MVYEQKRYNKYNEKFWIKRKKVDHYIFLLYIEMSETTSYQRNRDPKLNRAKDY